MHPTKHRLQIRRLRHRQVDRVIEAGGMDFEELHGAARLPRRC